MATNRASVGIACRWVMAVLSGMGLEHQYSRDALTGHGRLERRAPAVWKQRAPLVRRLHQTPSEGATAPATSRRTWPNGSTARTWSMSAARLIIRSPKERSTAGISGA